MKHKFFGLALLSLSITAYSANYQQFVAPDSLGKNISTLNKTYQLGLKKDSDQVYPNIITYSNSEKSPCNLSVETTKTGAITKITIYDYGKCSFKTNNPIVYDIKKTTTKDILNQVKLSDISFQVGCFNCPSRIEITDTLTIKRPQDKFYTKFEIEGYNTKLHDGLVQLYLDNGINKDNYFEYMDKLEKLMDDKPELYDRDEVKRLAIKTYRLDRQPYSYSIGQ